MKKKNKKNKKQKEERRGVTLDELTDGVNDLLEQGLFEPENTGIKKYEASEKKERNSVSYWYSRGMCESFIAGSASGSHEDYYLKARRSFNNALNIKTKKRDEILLQEQLLWMIKGDEYHIVHCVEDFRNCTICQHIKKRKVRK